MKKISCCFLSIILCICLCSCNTDHNSDFDQYTKTLLQEEFSNHPLDAYFFFSDPKSLGINISKDNISLGNFPTDSPKEITKKKDFKVSSLSLEQQLTYDLLSYEQELDSKLADYPYFYEPLSAYNGIHLQLPLLLAEFPLTSEEKIEVYFALLSDFPRFFDELIQYEDEKRNQNLFLCSSLLNKVITSCNQFLAAKDNNLLLLSFANRMDHCDFLSEQEKQKYLEENEELFSSKVVPAYENLLTYLEEHQADSTSAEGLCYKDGGRDYYPLLVQQLTGSSKSVEQLYNQIATQRKYDLSGLASLLEGDPSLPSDCYEISLGFYDDASIISYLIEKTKDAFPAPTTRDYELSYVDSSLSDYVAPAFYITAPWDAINENHVFVNEAKKTDDVSFFTTLSHESFPGHLYQTTMTYHYGYNPVRLLYACDGYTEGWATYTEMYSYSFLPLKQNLSSFLQKNQSTMLSLYATSDIGIHYYGWKIEDLRDFWKDYGVTDQYSLNEIYDLVLSNPGNYLSYYVGYLEFLELKDTMAKKYGEDFSIKEFHKIILSIGPSPFSILEKYYPRYYSFFKSS